MKTKLCFFIGKEPFDNLIRIDNQEIISIQHAPTYMYVHTTGMTYTTQAIWLE